MKIHPKTRKEYDQLCDETMAYFRKLMEEYPQITMYKSMLCPDMDDSERFGRGCTLILCEGHTGRNLSYKNYE